MYKVINELNGFEIDRIYSKEEIEKLGVPYYVINEWVKEGYLEEQNQSTNKKLKSNSNNDEDLTQDELEGSIQ